MIILKNLSNFLIFKDKKNKKIDNTFYTDRFNLVEIPLNKDISALIGYKYLHGNLSDGEYIEIKILNSTISIKNDNYSSIPIYIYEDSHFLVVSSAIFLINKSLPHNLNLDSNYLYTYFAFGYLPATTKTIFKNVNTVEPNSHIILDKKL